MNERIYDMATEAAEHALLNPSEDALQSEAEGYDTITVPRQFIDKFAELIVRECASMSRVYSSHEYDFTGDLELDEFMLKHFGVEE